MDAWVYIEADRRQAAQREYAFRRSLSISAVRCGSSLKQLFPGLPLRRVWRSGADGHGCEASWHPARLTRLCLSGLKSAEDSMAKISMPVLHLLAESLP